MIHELWNQHEMVKFVWDEPSLEIDEVHVYRFMLHNGDDGYYDDDIVPRKDARRCWVTLVGLGYKPTPLLDPPSYEN